MSFEEAIKRAENECARASYNFETLNNPGLTKAYGNKAEYLSILLYLAKKGLQADLASLREVLEDTPTADVVEVKHGEWISVEGDVIFKCSICEVEISTSWDYDNEKYVLLLPVLRCKNGRR